MDNPAADGRGTRSGRYRSGSVYGGAGSGVAALAVVAIGFPRGRFSAVMGPGRRRNGQVPGI